jgi:hypothetical protein
MPEATGMTDRLKGFSVIRLQRLRDVLLLLTVVGLAVGAVHPAPATAAAEVAFYLGRDVSTEDEMYVREGIRLAQDFLETRLGAAVEGRVIVNALAAAPRGNRNVVGMSQERVVVIYTGTDGWRRAPPFERVHVVVHELVHVWQWERRGGDSSRSPLWLDEGIADYLGYRAVIEAGLVSAEDVVAHHERSLILGPPLPELPALEPRQRFQSQPAVAYNLAYLAVADLIEGRSLQRIRRYYERLAAGDDWQDAFRRSFRQDPDAFYAAFEARRSELQRPPERPAPFRSAAPVSIAAEVTIEAIAPEIGRGEQLILVAGSEAGARCILTVTTSEGERLLRQRTFADATGLVFWLWSVPPGADPGEATARVRCGDEPARALLVIT